jgi:hypothetical protein
MYKKIKQQFSLLDQKYSVASTPFLDCSRQIYKLVRYLDYRGNNVFIFLFPDEGDHGHYSILVSINVGK